MKIIFVRHGQDDKRYRGGFSKTPLIEEGIIQAKKLAEFLFLNNEELNIRRIVTSDLKRTLETSSYISEKLNIAIEKDERIREMNNGDLADMLNEDAAIKYPGVYGNTLEMDEHYPNGESPKEFYTRIENWLNDFIVSNKNSDGNILVVTHGGVIKIIYHIINNIPWTNKINDYKTTCCGIHILDTETFKFEVSDRTDYLQ